MARDLGLRNVELRAADLRTIGEADGKFDYIVAHGVYSWVPVEVRDALLAVCRARLSPQGVAYISYNVFPGRYPRHALRQMLLHETRGIADPRGCAGRSCRCSRLEVQIDPQRGMIGRSVRSLLDLGQVGEPRSMLATPHPASLDAAGLDPIRQPR